MQDNLLLGVIITVLSGLVMGTSAWPLKLMRHFKYEHFALVSMAFSLLILPWAITLAMCPDAVDAYRSVPIVTTFRARSGRSPGVLGLTVVRPNA
jgi:tellurite resistance protein TehA-like permease